ncbi:MAG: right-handed parallel beta-helix repeat-containing protein, partial [Bacteroidales bacterium]|nr:right-handed parallel beta-helix repeat-containing protein [Bacteroidales bacterium]
MRKLVIFASLALAFVSVACEKENNKEQPAPIDPNTVVFTASLPTKTTIDANDQVVSWASGDEVKFVWAGGSTTAAASSSGSSTTFTVEVAEGITELYAVYPASAGGSYDEGKVNVNFEASHADGSFAANDICVAKAVKTGGTWTTSIVFKNVACLMKVGVTSSEIVKLRIQAEGGEAISGVLPVSMDGSGDPVFGVASSTSDMVSVTVSGPGNYYIPVMPGVTMASGFRVARFIGETDQTTPFFYSGSFTTTRGEIVKIADVDSHAGQFYVTPSGAGSKAGQSWTNAMGIAEFKAFVTNQDNHFLLKGATFHFSADEFSFGDDYLKLDYPDHGNVAFTLEGTVTPTDTTTFLGRTALEGTTAGVLWPQQNSYITVKNVKFTGTNGASNASVIRINNSAKEVNLDHCYFRNNSTSGNGGAISLFNSATLNITNCSFSNGTCAGGIVHVNNASAVVNISDSEAKVFTKNAIYVQNCNTFTATRVTFKDNNDAGEYGAAAYVTGSGVVSFNDCDFIRNHSTVQGGAICVNGTSVTTTFTDCDFIDNWCDAKGGAVMIESGNANTTFTGGKFQGNHADGAHNTNAAGA